MTTIIGEDQKPEIWHELERSALFNRILELGPFNGRHTVRLAQHCRQLLAVEVRPENVEATRQAVAAIGRRNVTVIEQNLEALEFATLGRFDLVWCSGVLYHMAAPWRLVHEIASVTDLCLGWTHLADAAIEDAEGYSGYWSDEGIGPMAGAMPRSFWLVPSEMQRLWKDAGMNLRFLNDPKPHGNGGLAAQFISER